MCLKAEQDPMVIITVSLKMDMFQYHGVSRCIVSPFWDKRILRTVDLLASSAQASFGSILIPLDLDVWKWNGNGAGAITRKRQQK